MVCKAEGAYMAKKSACLVIFKTIWGGAWVAQSVEQPTHGFYSGPDLRVVGLSGALCSAQSLLRTLPPSAPPPCSLKSSLSK